MIFVSGATGNVGGEIVRKLVETGHKIRVVSRNAELASRFPKSVEFVCGDLTRPETMPNLLAGIEKAYLLAHPMDLRSITRNFSKLALDAGVRHVVLNSSGMPPNTRIGQWHLEAERELKDSGLSWTILRPGNFASNAMRWAGMIRSQGAVFAPGNAKTIPIDPRDIGLVATKILTGSGHEQKTYILTGPEALTPSEQVATIGGVIGKTLRYVEVSTETAKANMVKSGMPETMADAILELIEEHDPESPQANSMVHDITGRPSRTFAEWVKDHARHFLS